MEGAGEGVAEGASGAAALAALAAEGPEVVALPGAAAIAAPLPGGFGDESGRVGAGAEARTIDGAGVSPPGAELGAPAAVPLSIAGAGVAAAVILCRRGRITSAPATPTASIAPARKTAARARFRGPGTADVVPASVGFVTSRLPRLTGAAG